MTEAKLSPALEQDLGFEVYRDILDQSVDRLEMLQHIDTKESMNMSARHGVFLTLGTVIESLKYLSEELERVQKNIHLSRLRPPD